MPDLLRTLVGRNRDGRFGAVAGVCAVCAVVALAGRTSGVVAQEASGDGTRCDLLENRYVRSLVTAGGDRINYISGPVLLRCDDGLRVEADSVVEFTANRFRQLYGDVVMDGPESRMRADRVYDFGDAGRVQAWGAVEVFEKVDSMRIVGDTLRLLRANDIRPEDRLSVWGDDTYALVRFQGSSEETDSVGGEEPDSVESEVADSMRPAVDVPEAREGRPARDTVRARRIHLEGRSRFAASGSVRIVSGDVVARSDSADYVRDEGTLRLIPADPEAISRVTGEAYELTSRTMDVGLGPRGIREIEAREDALLSGRDVRLSAPVVRIFLAAGEIDRLVAVRGEPTEDEAEGADADSTTAARPEALAEDFHLRADSIEVVAPSQRLETLFAAGNARGEALGRDSLNTDETPDIARTDWIEGESILATFAPTDSLVGPDRPTARPPGEASDSGRARFRLERLVATGSARSLYRLVRRDSTEAAGDSAAAPGQEASPDTGEAPEGPASDTSSAPEMPSDTAAGDRPERPRLAIHYVTGRVITIHMAEGEVSEMEVEGQTRGLYLEPGALRRGPPAADTSSAPGAGEEAPSGGQLPDRPPPGRER